MRSRTDTLYYLPASPYTTSQHLATLPSGREHSRLSFPGKTVKTRHNSRLQGLYRRRTPQLWPCVVGLHLGAEPSPREPRRPDDRLGIPPQSTWLGRWLDAL